MNLNDLCGRYRSEELAGLPSEELAVVDAGGREAAGYYHTEFYLSRPQAEALEVPLEELVG